MKPYEVKLETYLGTQTGLISYNYQVFNGRPTN